MLSNDFKLKIIETIKRINPQKIILFGSYAKDNYTEDSDIDLFIIKEIKKEDVQKERLMIKKLLWMQFKNDSISFDVLLDNNERIQNRINNGDLFYDEILKKGEVLYA